MNKSASKAIRHFVNKSNEGKTETDKKVSSKRVKKLYHTMPHTMRAGVKAYMQKV